MIQGKGDSLSGNLVSHVNKLPDSIRELELHHNLFPKVFGISSQVPVDKIKEKEILMLSINASITGGTVSSIKEDKIKISLKVPVTVFPKDNVGIARNIQGHWRLIGYGEII